MFVQSENIYLIKDTCLMLSYKNTSSDMSDHRVFYLEVTQLWLKMVTDQKVALWLGLAQRHSNLVHTVWSDNMSITLFTQSNIIAVKTTQRLCLFALSELNNAKSHHCVISESKPVGTQLRRNVVFLFNNKTTPIIHCLCYVADDFILCSGVSSTKTLRCLGL